MPPTAQPKSCKHVGVSGWILRTAWCEKIQINKNLCPNIAIFFFMSRRLLLRQNRWMMGVKKKKKKPQTKAGEMRRMRDLKLSS